MGRYYPNRSTEGDELTFPLTLNLLTWTKWRAPASASKWRMGFNSVFKGLNIVYTLIILTTCVMRSEKLAVSCTGTCFLLHWKIKFTKVDGLQLESRSTCYLKRVLRES